MRMSRETVVARVLSGQMWLTVRNKDFYVVTATPQQQFHAARLYEETLSKAELDGVPSQEEINRLVLFEGLWNEEKEKELKTLESDIEELKFRLFKLVFKSEQRAMTRKMLAVAKDRYQKLYKEKHVYDGMSCESAASYAKTRFLLGCATYYEDGTPLWKSKDDWKLEPDIFLDGLMIAFVDSQISETTFRDVVRNEPWRSKWIAHKVENRLFDVSPASLTSDQQTIIMWSQLYDNVYQSSECPDDNVVQDDDMLDGWFICQKREREKNQLKKQGDELANKHQGADEVYVPVESAKDAQAVIALNDIHNNVLRKQRMDLVKSKGEVNELELPDVQLKFQQRAREAILKKGKG